MYTNFLDWLLADNVSVQSTILRANDRPDQDFELWFLANGGFIHPSVEIASSPSDGMFLRVKQDHILPADTTIISCPNCLTISWPSAQEYHHPDVSIPPFSQHVATRLFLMKQYLAKESSPWWPYLSTLPSLHQESPFNTPLWYDKNDLIWIKGTNLGNGKKVREDAWRKEYDEVMSQLFPPGCNLELKKLWNWQLYLWAATVMTTRSFAGRAVFNQLRDRFPTYSDREDGRCPVLIPGLDLMNHNPASSVAWLWGPAQCTFKTEEVIHGGVQIWNNYGPKSNEELIMGYGFSLSENSADHVSVSFSPSILQYIKATKARRLAAISQSERIENRIPGDDVEVSGRSSKFSPALSDTMHPVGETDSNVHYVEARPNGGYSFSPQFLEDFSIAVENPRERLRAKTLPQFKINMQDGILSRNKLHVMCAVSMILQKNRAAIHRYDQDLPRTPQNDKQIDAARYRKNQLRILDIALDSLCSTLKSIVGLNTTVRDLRIIRLDNIISESPRRLLKDFRSVLNTGLRTRDPIKIRERGGADFAFTIWLCGIWLWVSETGVSAQHITTSGSRMESRLSEWIMFLQNHYENLIKDDELMPLIRDNSAINQEAEKNTWFDPIRNSIRQEDAEPDISVITASYLDAVHKTTHKHPESLYNDPRITAKRLGWCLHIVRMEGVWCPNLKEGGEEDDDEWVLFLEEDDA